MQLSQSLALEIRTYIRNLLSKDVVIVNSEGVCISSSNEKEVGDTINIPQDVLQGNDSRSLQLNGGQQLLIPLRYQTETVASLVLQDSSSDVKNYVPLIKSFAELLVQQYLDVNRPVLDSTDQFITKLLEHATPADIPLYESEAKVLGYTFDVPRLAIVIHLRDFWEKCLAAFDQPTFEREEVIKDWKRNIEIKLSSFFTQGSDSIIAYVGNDKFVVFKAIESDDEQTIKLLKKSHKAIFEPLKNFTITDLAVGFGNASNGIQGLIDAYREADLAVEFGARLWGDNKSYYFGDLGILSILGEGNREKEKLFADQLLKKLTNDDLIKTLECFFDENLNLTETANRMGIHRNTVIYRLNQIALILGADPRVFEQAMTIKIALLIRKLFG